MIEETILGFAIKPLDQTVIDIIMKDRMERSAIRRLAQAMLDASDDALDRVIIPGMHDALIHAGHPTLELKSAIATVIDGLKNEGRNRTSTNPAPK